MGLYEDAQEHAKSQVIGADRLTRTLLVYGTPKAGSTISSRETAEAFIKRIRQGGTPFVHQEHELWYLLDPATLRIEPRGQNAGQEWGYVVGEYLRVKNGGVSQ